MSDVLTVQTQFSDIADLAQGFIGRVNARQIVVAAGEAIEAGQAVRFQVLLTDGVAAFWADGHCAQVNDLGDDVDASERYELLLHSLTFADEASQQVFEYMVSISESATPNDELTASESGFEAAEVGTGEVGTDEMEALDAVSVPPSEADSVPAPPPSFAPHATDTSEAFAAPSVPPPQFNDEIPRALSDRPGPPPGGVLTRMAMGNTWRPQRAEKRQPAARSGLFKYSFGHLPTPQRPPRPELDASLRVTAAPRPTA